MFWASTQYKWLNASIVEFNRNLSFLVDENPLFQVGGISRPCGCSISELRERTWKAILKFVSDNFSNLNQLPSNQKFQESLEREITKYLAQTHYEFALGSSLSGSIPVRLKQFWWTASYYVCRRVFVGAKSHLKMHFLDSIADGRNFFSDEFYGFDGRKRRHSAIVLKCVEKNRFLMVPFSHSPHKKGGNLRVVVRDRNRAEDPKFALCKIYFYVNQAMLSREFEDPFGLTITEADFSSIAGKVEQMLERL